MLDIRGRAVREFQLSRVSLFSKQSLLDGPWFAVQFQKDSAKPVVPFLLALRSKRYIPSKEVPVSIQRVSILVVALAVSSVLFAQNQPTYDINTLAGKVASLNGTAGLQIRFSAFIEEEADVSSEIIPPVATTPITPTFVLSSPLDGTSRVAPDVLVNQDAAAAPQNETSIAVDPNNPKRVVASANDYVSRTWSCVISGTPCSALGDGYSGTYFSNDGGATWCCTPTDPDHLGTMIPGVERLTGGIYDAGGDPSVAFDSAGHVFYAGLGFDRTAPPNTVAVNKGIFDSEGKLSWGAPTFINP